MTDKATPYSETQPASPGDVVRRELEKRGWTQSDLAYVLGAKTAAISPVLAGKRGISPDMAKALAVAFDMQADVFARAQAEWELLTAREPDPQVAARARIQTAYPLREMMRRGWLTEDQDVEPQLCRFFGVASIDNAPYMPHAAKRSSEDLSALQIAWLFRVRQIARQMTPSGKFTKESLEQAIEQLGSLRGEVDGIRQVPRVLNQAGVRFVVVEALPGSKIDGVCLWLDPYSPVIGLSLRFDRIDNFWFVLLHECAHVLHGHGKSEPIVDSEMEKPQDINEEERIANSEGAGFCVPHKQMQSFYLRKNPLFAERDVLAFATRMGVHPGIAVGQLQRLSGRYDLLRKHLIKIRHVLADAMMMDGWGDVMPTG